MAKVEPTSAPWKLAKMGRKTFLIGKPGGAPFAEIKFRLGDGYGDNTRHDNIADALLMEQAPSLLAAARRLVAACDEFFQDDLDGLDELKLAIDNATRLDSDWKPTPKKKPNPKRSEAPDA